MRASRPSDHLGGEDFDRAMAEAIVRRVQMKHGKDLTKGRDSIKEVEKVKALSRLRRLRAVCENQKKSYLMFLQLR